MGLVKGLDDINRHVKERQESGENREFREVQRLKLNPGESKKIRFVQELDEKAENYDKKLGLGLVAAERCHPDGDRYPGGPLWWLRLVDRTEEDGYDWCAEQGWELKAKFYINVVDVSTGQVFLWERSPFSPLAESVFGTATERGTLTDTVWKISRGPGKKGQYSLALVNITEEPLEVSPDDVYDIEEEVLHNVPADEQEEYVRKITERVMSKGDDDEDSEEESDSVW